MNICQCLRALPFIVCCYILHCKLYYYAEERLDLVEIFFHDLSVRRTVQDYLKLVPDYFWLAKKIRKGKGSLQVSTDTTCIRD